MTSEMRFGESYPQRFPRWLIPTITGILALAFGAFSYHQGISTSPDTETYSKWADLLISTRFNYPRFAREASFVFPPTLYCGWITVVALFKLLLGSAWTTGIVLLNYALALLSIWALLNLIKQITHSTLCVLLAGALTLVAYEQFKWIHFALSDISFMALTFAILYLLCAPADKSENIKSGGFSAKRVCLILLVILTVLYRPTGFPLLIPLSLAYLTRRAIHLKSSAVRSHFARRVGIILFILGISGIILHAYLMRNPSAWPFTFASEWIKTLSSEYYKGYVVYHRPETYYLNPVSLLDFIIITLSKLAYFFSFYSGSFSLVHNLVNSIFFVPAYLLSLLAIYRMFQTNSNITPEAWWSGWIALWAIISYALFHAFQQVDYDWRYRLPCMLPLIMLASIGLSSVLRRKDSVRGVTQLRVA